MGLVIGRAKEGEGGNCKQQGAAKQVAGKREGADNFKSKRPRNFQNFVRGASNVDACLLPIAAWLIKGGRLGRKSLAELDSILLLGLT